MRADQLLQQRGLAASRTQAQRLIEAGVQWRLHEHAAWQPVTKNAEALPEHCELQVSAALPYVSRGGIKLEGALRHTGLNLQGLTVLDVGQSTGGFTDCALQHGAQRVLGIDVGHRQLHPRLRDHPQVLALEGLNARHLDPVAVRQHCHTQGGSVWRDFTAVDVVVGDLSFISQTLVWPAVQPLLKAMGHWLMLVKPQFELSPQDLGKGGMVRVTPHANPYDRVQGKIEGMVQQLGCRVLSYFESPIAGGDGNREFFVWAQQPTVTHHKSSCAHP